MINKKYINKILKRFSALLMIFTITVLGGCASDVSQKAKDGKIKILCAGFSQFDWVSNITEGSKTAEVVSLYKSGVDIHSFQPSAADIINIEECDMFVYNGGESDLPIEDILKNSKNGERLDFNCMLKLGEGVLNEDESVVTEHDHEGEHHHDDEALDEHIWLSVRNAAVLSEKLCEDISKIDPASAELYRKNTDEYIKKLNELDLRFNQEVSKSDKKVMVIADRFPFRYLAADYEIECFAAFSGCSTDTEASFGTVLELANRVKEFDLRYIVSVDGGQTSIADSVCAAADRELEVLEMNSLQTVTDKQREEGLTYLSAMEENLKTIQTVLNREG